MGVKEEKLLEIQKRMINLGISENDIEEKFILASKKGGQKVQKTSSCVYLKHLPTGIEVKCQKDRLRETNRLFARRILCDMYEEKILNIKTKKQIKLDKIKKQKTRRTRRSKEKYG
jgi:peptide chain release factor